MIARVRLNRAHSYENAISFGHPSEKRFIVLNSGGLLTGSILIRQHYEAKNIHATFHSKACLTLNIYR